MIVIRLARGGKKSKPFYRVVVADRRFPRDGRFIERLGFYNPVANRSGDQIIELKLDRIEHWVKQGAQLSQRVAAIVKRQQAAVTQAA
jgi:small subunit ribosomal protein S16